MINNFEVVSNILRTPIILDSPSVPPHREHHMALYSQSMGTVRSESAFVLRQIQINQNREFSFVYCEGGRYNMPTAEL